jgi:hypothetical protein
MGFRFQRRINLGGGWGINAGGSGGSLSYRDRSGSIGTKGYSIRTGLPGLSYRGRWGKNSAGAIAVIFLAIAVAAVAIQVLLVIVQVVWKVVSWIALTLYDLSSYGIQQFRAWRARPDRVRSTPPE